MRFALALLGLIAVPFASASALPRDSYNIVARDGNELDARLLGDLLGGGKDKWDNKHCGWKIKDCSSRGQKCTNKCECEYEHPPKDKCNKHEKDACYQKGWHYNEEHCKCEKPECNKYEKDACYQKGWHYNDEHCKCEKPECNKYEKEQCHRDKGTYDDYNCKCTKPEPPKCKDWDRKECEWKHGKFDEHTCKCEVKYEPPRCKDWDRKECEWKHGKFDEHSCKCEYKNDPPKGDHCPKEMKDKCSSRGGKCNDQCKCEKDGGILDIDIGGGGIKLGLF